MFALVICNDKLTFTLNGNTLRHACYEYYVMFYLKLDLLSYSSSKSKTLENLVCLNWLSPFYQFVNKKEVYKKKLFETYITT